MPTTPDVRTKEQLEQEKLKGEIQDLRIWTPAKTLFGVITGFVTAGVAIYGLLYPDGPLRTSLANQEEALRQQALQLETSRLNISSIFTSIISEPSGIVQTCLRNKGAPIFLVIDDEEFSPFLAQRVGNSLLPIASVFLPKKENADKGDQERIETEDLEAVSVISKSGNCADWQYLVMSSHREHDKKRTNRVVKFKLQELGASEPAYKATSLVEFTFADEMVTFFKSNNKTLFSIDELPKRGDDEKEEKTRYALKGQDWSTDTKNSSQPYALEVEAAHAIEDEFWLGLKYPLLGENAVILKYSVDSIHRATKKSGPTAIKYEPLDLGKQGISAMSSYGSCVIIAANPPQKGATDQSTLHVFNRTEGGTLNSLAKLGGDKVNLVGRNLKLEGLTIETDADAHGGQWLWLAYDAGMGNSSEFRLVNLEELLDYEVRRTCTSASG